MLAPFIVAPPPREDTYNSPSAGKYSTPTSGPAASQRAMETPQCWTPSAKLVVPSSGSTTQVRCDDDDDSTAEAGASSSLRMASNGKCACNSAAISLSAATSASVTIE